MAKRAPAKKTAQPRPTRPPDPPEPEAQKAFDPQPDGSLILRFQTGQPGTYFEHYLRGPLKVGAWRELDEQRITDTNWMIKANNDALAMVSDESDEQREAKLAALKAVRDEEYDRFTAWWTALFKAGGATFPEDQAEAWLHSPTTTIRALLHLRGPLPPGAA